MTKQLGPTFGDETIAAGLGGLPFGWCDTDDSITGRGNLTPPQNATLDSVVNAHDSTKKRKNMINTSDFVARWTNAEYLALSKQRTLDNGHTAKTWDIVFAESHVDLNKQKAQNLKASLVTDGILTQARADAIFDTPAIVILRIAVGVITIIVTLLLLALLDRDAGSQTYPPLQSSAYDRKLNRLDRAGIEGAYRGRVQLLFSNWMTDTNQESANRAVRGHRNARKIYIEAMTELDARDPPSDDDLK